MTDLNPSKEVMDSDHEKSRTFVVELPGTADVNASIDAINDNTAAYEHAHGEIDPDLHRTLSGRQITMMAIAGTIGTGLFLGVGKAVANGGAAGAFIGYCIVAVFVGCVMMSLGEMSVHSPHSGNFVAFADNYVHPSLGFATGWAYYGYAALTPPAEITAASILLRFWDRNENHLAIYLAVMIIFIAAVNWFGAKYFGEVEFWFGALKVITIIGLILLGIVLDLGGGPTHDRIGFRHWREFPFNSSFGQISNPSTARFAGFWAVMTQASYSFTGIEAIAVLAGEAKNPQKSLSFAFRQVFLRIGLLYLVSVFVITMCISGQDPSLLGALKGATSVTQSPFVIMITRANIKALPSIINAVVFSSALSSSNEAFFVGSRTLVALSRQRQAPKIFLRTTTRGTPLYAWAAGIAFMLLAFLCVSKTSDQVFIWLTNLTTLCSLLSWISISISFIRFHKLCKAAKIERRTFAFRGWFQPYQAWAALIFFSVVIFFNGFATFIGSFSAADFIAAYITLPIFFALFLGHKFVTKSKLVKFDVYAE